MYEGLIEELAQKNERKILLAVIDGLGDISTSELDGRTPLEAAETPVMDELAATGALGCHIPVARGVTPGSGPAHLGLFGYDPVKYQVGRGVLAALGVEFPLQHGDLAARINFCTVDGEGKVIDRRAGRISTETCRKLSSILDSITVPGLEVHVVPVKEHRACVVFRGEGLTDDIPDTDPGLVDHRKVPVKGSGKSRDAVRLFQQRAAELLKDRHPANDILMRGFAVHRDLPCMNTRFQLNSASVALYPMYRGVARLVGMKGFDSSPATLQGQAKAVEDALTRGFDYIFLHHKPADSSGEDGNVPAKIRAIEEFDRALPSILHHGFDVICITGDHSTPCSMKLHSWHPVPLLISGGPQRTGISSCFSEREALGGALGTMHSTDIIALLLASAGKLAKFGA